MATMKEITYAQAINDAMCEEMQRDENVFMMGEDIAEYCGAFGVSRGMLEKDVKLRRQPGCWLRSSHSFKECVIAHWSSDFAPKI